MPVVGAGPGDRVHHDLGVAHHLAAMLSERRAVKTSSTGSPWGSAPFTIKWATHG